MTPAVVINAYNRPGSLQRLLQSLGAACYPAGLDVPLVISIDDASRQPDVVEVAQQFQWNAGSKEVLCRPGPLGLIAHFYACGSLAEKYGSIIYLEDDLIVSLVFYFYASQALNYYREDERIGGISLYNLWFNGYTLEPFTPSLDEADSFFIQVPYTQGEAFTAGQWERFRSWQANRPSPSPIHKPLHESWAQFQPDEWFPEWARYLVDTDRFFVYPRASLTAGSGDAGAHFSRPSRTFQVPLQQGKTAYQFKPLDASLAVYDSFFEILPDRLNRQTDLIKGYAYTVDLNATRSQANIPAKYVLTTRQARRPLFTFGKSMWPIEANVIQRLPGAGISFCRTEDLLWGRLAELRTWASNRAYYSRGRLPGLRDWVKMKLARAIANRGC